MTREDLFLAIGQVEEDRLARSEAGHGKRISFGRAACIVLAAALIVSTLAVTAFAVTGFLIYESPEKLLTSIFGDQTGFDHREVTTATDPWQPGSSWEVPGYDRVPADTAVVAEDVAPYVSPVGQVLVRDGYTLTVDAYLYDSVTRCGIVTYTLEGEKGLPEYHLQTTGEIWYAGPDPVDFSQYGYPYIILEKTTETKLAAAYYFAFDPAVQKDFTVALGEDTDMSDAERNQVVMACEQEIRQSYTPEEAVQTVQDMMGEIPFRRYSEGVPEAEAAYTYLTHELYFSRVDTREKITFDCSEDRKLEHITLAEGSMVITPISLTLDITDMEFLHKQVEDKVRIDTGYVESLVIRYRDGTAYVVDAPDTCNTVFRVSSIPQDAAAGNHALMTCMFNRIVDIDKVEAVLVNGVELTIDP